MKRRIGHTTISAVPVLMLVAIVLMMVRVSILVAGTIAMEKGGLPPDFSPAVSPPDLAIPPQGLEKAYEPYFSDVTFLENSETAFVGQAVGAAGPAPGDKASLRPAPPVPGAEFSAVAAADGSMEILIRLNKRGRLFRAFVDPEGDIVRLRSETFDGRTARFDREDREQLKALAQAMRPTYDDRTHVRERFGTVSNFLTGMLPEGLTVDIHFTKKEGKDPQTGEMLIEKCMAFDSLILNSLLGGDLVDDFRAGRLDTWLTVRGWHYDKDRDAICGLSNTRLCNYVGRRYRGQKGYVTTAPLRSIFNPTEPPHETVYYGGNQVPIGVIQVIPDTTSFEFCPGRCGPGCGEGVGDYYNSSVFNFTAECFAHDACIGEVGSSDMVPGIGTGGACADELINATWGFINGAPCNAASKDDLFGWWLFDGAQYRQLDRAGNLVKYENGQHTDLGRYVVNRNSFGDRWVHIREDGSTGPERLTVGKVARTTPIRISGSSTPDNSSAASFNAVKVTLMGYVYDPITKKPVKDVLVTILGDNLQLVKKKQKTDAKGVFLFNDVSPYDSYTVTLSKPGYRKLKKEEVAPRTDDKIPSYRLVPEGFKFTTTLDGGSIEWILWGPGEVWYGGTDNTVEYYWYIPPEDGTPVKLSARLTPYTCCDEENAYHHFFIHEFGSSRIREFECPTPQVGTMTREFMISGDTNIAAAYFASCGPLKGFAQVTINPHYGPAPNGIDESSFSLLPPRKGAVRVFTSESVFAPDTEEEETSEELFEE